MWRYIYPIIITQPLGLVSVIGHLRIKIIVKGPIVFPSGRSTDLLIFLRIGHRYLPFHWKSSQSHCFCKFLNLRPSVLVTIPLKTLTVHNAAKQETTQVLIAFLIFSGLIFRIVGRWNSLLVNWNEKNAAKTKEKSGEIKGPENLVWHLSYCSCCRFLFMFFVLSIYLSPLFLNFLSFPFCLSHSFSCLSLAYCCNSFFLLSLSFLFHGKFSLTLSLSHTLSFLSSVLASFYSL